MRTVLLAVFTLAGAAPAAYLESDTGQAVKRPEPPRRILPPPAPDRAIPGVAAVVTPSIEAVRTKLDTLSKP